MVGRRSFLVGPVAAAGALGGDILVGDELGDEDDPDEEEDEFDEDEEEEELDDESGDDEFEGLILGANFGTVAGDFVSVPAAAAAAAAAACSARFFATNPLNFFFRFSFESGFVVVWSTSLSAELLLELSEEDDESSLSLELSSPDDDPLLLEELSLS